MLPRPPMNIRSKGQRSGSHCQKAATRQPCGAVMWWRNKTAPHGRRELWTLSIAQLLVILCFCVFLVVVWLSVPAQSIVCNDSSPKSSIMCQVWRHTLLTVHYWIDWFLLNCCVWASCSDHRELWYVCWQADENYTSLLQLAQESLPSLQYHVCLDVVDASVTLASFVYVNTDVCVTLDSNRSRNNLILRNGV